MRRQQNAIVREEGATGEANAAWERQVESRRHGRMA